MAGRTRHHEPSNAMNISRVATIDLFPVFDVASWLLACWTVREDIETFEPHGR